ncbi:TatD family hydrolase, partial [Candidatus Woesearchaeota archaeon]|nr:TatD family hydrolase [Candidatus Woesearchaeota archaeon]
FDEDRDEIITRMSDDDIWTIIVGTNPTTSQEAVELAQKNKHLFATVGIHPTDTEEPFDKKLFSKLAEEPSVVGIGECGFDYFRTDRDESKKTQQPLFEQHIELALEHDLPLMLHMRTSKGSMDAYEDALDILESYHARTGDKVRGNSHFFAGDTTIARRFLDIGFTISFDGPITFTTDYDDVVRYVPQDMLLAETDAPFAAPDPHRGKRNEPHYVI